MREDTSEGGDIARHDMKGECNQKGGGSTPHLLQQKTKDENRPSQERDEPPLLLHQVLPIDGPPSRIRDLPNPLRRIQVVAIHPLRPTRLESLSTVFAVVREDGDGRGEEPRTTAHAPGVDGARDVVGRLDDLTGAEAEDLAEGGLDHEGETADAVDGLVEVDEGRLSD